MSAEPPALSIKLGDVTGFEPKVYVLFVGRGDGQRADAIVLDGGERTMVELTNAAISCSHKAILATKKLVPDLEMTVELETGPPITQPQGGDALTGDVKGGIRGFCMGVRRFSHRISMDSRRIRESSRSDSHKFARVCRVRDAFVKMAKIRNGFSAFATDSRIRERIRDAFAKVLDEVHTNSRRIRGGFAHSPSQFAHIRKGSRLLRDGYDTVRQVKSANAALHVIRALWLFVNVPLQGTDSPQHLWCVQLSTQDFPR
eukprot:1321724-Prymnesium_polylepis.1